MLALIEQFRRVDAGMRDLPIYNDKVAIEAIGFRPFGDDALLGVVLTPWFMNLIMLPIEPVPMDMAEIGKTVPVELPAGQRTFVVGGDETVGLYKAHSLHSPVLNFTLPGQARAEAQRMLALLMTPATGTDGSRGNKRPHRSRRRSPRAAIRPPESVNPVCSATDQTRPITSPVPISPIAAPQACMTRRLGASSNRPYGQAERDAEAVQQRGCDHEAACHRAIPEPLTGISVPWAWPWKIAKMPTSAMAARTGGAIPDENHKPKYNDRQRDRGLGEGQ